MSDLNKELAKIYLEQRGFLTALDLQMDQEGYDAPGFDLLGVEITKGQVSQAVVGVVRGWWHAGSYLTPGLIRYHLETERQFLSESFSPEKIQYVRDKFGLGLAPIRNVLFYSQRSPKKSEEVEKILSAKSIEIVYLEDIIVEVLPKVGKVSLGDGIASQLLPMVRFSRLFREMREALRVAKKCMIDEAGDEDGKGQGTPAPKQPKPPDKQLDFMTAISSRGGREDGDHGSEED